MQFMDELAGLHFPFSTCHVRSCRCSPRQPRSAASFFSSMAWISLDEILRSTARNCTAKQQTAQRLSKGRRVTRSRRTWAAAAALCCSCVEFGVVETPDRAAPGPTAAVLGRWNEGGAISRANQVASCLIQSQRARQQAWRLTCKST